MIKKRLERQKENQDIKEVLDKKVEEEVLDKSVENEASLEKVLAVKEESVEDVKIEEKIKAAEKAIKENKLEEEVNYEKNLALNDSKTNNNLSFYDFQFPNIKDNSREFSKRASQLSVVNNKNGRRVELGFEASSHLGFSNKLQFGFLEDKIAIAEKFPGNQSSFTTRRSKNGRKLLIYNSELVKYITSFYGLCFENRTTISFYNCNCEYKTIDNTKVVFIKMR